MASMFQITGDKELDRKLAELPDKVERKVFRQAVREGAKQFLAPARALTPVLSGQLAASLKVRAGGRSRKFKGVSATVITEEGFFRGKTFYGAFREFGHRVGPRRLGDARRQVPGLHFLKRAYEANAEAVKAAASASLRAGVEREASGA